MNTRRNFGAALAAIIGGLTVVSLVLLARQDSGTGVGSPISRSDQDPASAGRPAGSLTAQDAGSTGRGASSWSAGDPGGPETLLLPVTATIVYSHTFEPTSAFPLARDSVSWSDSVHHGAPGVYSIRSPAAGEGATTPEWSYRALNGPRERQMSLFAAEPARDRRAETVRDADPPQALAAFVNLGGRKRAEWSDSDWFLAPVHEQPWLDPSAVARLEAEGAIVRADADVILGEDVTAWSTDALATWGAFREARRRTWLTSDGLKLRVESLDASGQVFATDEANTLTRGTLGDPEEPWRASGLPIRYTRLSSDIPADAPGEELVDRAASAGIPISATLYVTGTPHSGQLEVVDQDTSWAVVYEPASPAVFAVVVAPGDLAPPMWWHFWPGIRQAARPPLVQVDTASVALPADAQALEYPDGGGAMVTWLDGDVRAAVLALETSEALRVAELLSDGAR